VKPEGEFKSNEIERKTKPKRKKPWRKRKECMASTAF
jgi:hypothetical protein